MFVQRIGQCPPVSSSGTFSQQIPIHARTEPDQSTSTPFAATPLDQSFQHVTLPSFHELDSFARSGDSELGRRSSDVSLASTTSSIGLLQRSVTAPRQRTIERVQQICDHIPHLEHRHPYFPTPDHSPVQSPVTAPRRMSKSKKPRRSTRGVVKTSRACESPETFGGVDSQEEEETEQSRAERLQAEIKAEREKVARYDLARAIAGVQNVLLTINPKFPQLATPVPGRTGLRELKSNNVNKDIRKAGLVPLYYNKIDVLGGTEAVLVQDNELLERTVDYMKNIGKPEAVPWHEAAEMLERATQNRGCEAFQMPQFFQSSPPL